MANMKQLILSDLDKDIFIYKENSYRIKRYAYHNFNYVNEKGKKITERIFSFILMKGTKWYNDTHVELKESELDQVMDKFAPILEAKRKERKERLTLERSLRKQYPKQLAWKFKNVTITIELELDYTDSGYFLDETLRYHIFANKKPFRYGYGQIDRDFEITFDWIMERIANLYVARYNVNDLIGKNCTIVQKFKHSFVPYHFYIGYAIEHNGETYNITDARGKGFQTDKGDLDYPITELHKINVIGELQGMEAFVCLKNKFKYCE